MESIEQESVVEQSAALKWLATQHDEMAALLQQVVSIDSGSGDAEGIMRVAELFRAHLRSASIEVTTIPRIGWGECLYARIPGSNPFSKGHIQLMGHMDTVFPKGTVAERPWRVEDGKAFGPGVADMKSGLVLNVFVAEALARFGGNTAPVHLLFTCDEEVGSPVCAEVIREYSVGARAVLNAEPGRANGNVVNERKGSVRIEFEVEGVAAHAGVNPHQGASAISALAEKIRALDALHGCEEGIGINVGFVQAGVAANVVASHAKAFLDIRYRASNNIDQVLAKVKQIIEAETLPRTKGRITDQAGTLPMARTPGALLQLYQRSAKQVGFNVDAEATGGAADSGITSAMGIPSLCALGPVGGYPHSEREFCVLDSMVPRAQALAQTIIALG